jgi:putative Holliday junction resolvase
VRIAGIDFGTVRIGIALADTTLGIAGAFATYTLRGNAADARYFRDLVTSEGIERLVVGLPVHSSGSESQKSVEARAFGAWLAEETQTPVEFFDERYTSTEAESLLQSAKLTKKRRKARRDQLAAQIMLSAYLESGGRGQECVPPLDDP